MFTNLIFLILVLMLVSFAADMEHATWMLEPLAAFGASALLYIGLLGLIIFQNKLFKRARKQTLLTLVNFECLLFLALIHYLIGTHRLFTVGSFQTGVILYALSLYLAALYVFHWSWKTGSSREASNQIALLVPFALPFLLFTLLVDLFQLLPADNFLATFFNAASPWLGLIPSLFFLGAMLLFLPPLIVRFWRCVPMEDSDLKRRLEALCDKAQFAHGGFKTWGVMEGTLTAAIIGVLPALRYILFTPRLLKTFSPEAIEAILAHEIGHSYRKHLLYYPLIFLGMAVLMTLFSICCMGPLSKLFDQTFGNSWGQLFPLFLFIPIALIIWLYFRYVYGFYSRLFERQADLHVFALGIKPEAMIEALDHVGTGTGFTHLVPNWHHYSIQERIDFLKRAMQDPEVVPQHHRRVKQALYAYLVLLALGIAILTIYSGA